MKFVAGRVSYRVRYPAKRRMLEEWLVSIWPQGRSVHHRVSRQIWNGINQ